MLKNLRVSKFKTNLIMKKACLLIPVFCLFLIQQSIAQPGKGKAMLSLSSTIGLGDFGTDLLNVGMTTEKIKYGGTDGSSSYSTFGINLLPRVGYFVIDNLAVGADILVGFSSEKSKSSDYKYSESTLAIGPFGRYYFPMEKINPFIEANVGFGTWKQKYSNGTTNESKEGLLLFGVGAGAGKSLGENVMIEALVGYSSQTWKDEEETKYTYGTIGLKVGFTMFLNCGK
jgi:hypothetical protein